MRGSGWHTGRCYFVNSRLAGGSASAERTLNYNYFRDYSPQLGRYVQADPIGLEGGLNPFLYALGNPLRYSDPLGLDVLLCKRPADLPFPLNLFDHYWIKTDKYESGMGGECAVPGQGCADRPYSATATKDHTGQSKAANSTCEKMNNVDEMCVNEIIAPGQPTGPWHLFNQCQNFAYGAINRCRTGPQIPPVPPPVPKESPVPKAPAFDVRQLIRKN